MVPEIERDFNCFILHLLGELLESGLDYNFNLRNETNIRIALKPVKQDARFATLVLAIHARQH